MYNDLKSILISRIGLLDKLARVSCPILLALPIDTKDLLYSSLLLLCCRRAYFANKISKTKTNSVQAKDDPVSFDLFTIRCGQGHICEVFFLPQVGECFKDRF